MPLEEEVGRERAAVIDDAEDLFDGVVLVVEEALQRGVVEDWMERVLAAGGVQALGDELFGDAGGQCVEALDLAVFDGEPPVAFGEPGVDEGLVDVGGA